RSLADEMEKVCDGQPASIVMLALAIMAAKGIGRMRSSEAPIEAALENHMKLIGLTIAGGLWAAMATNKLRSFGALRYHHNKSGFRGVFYDAERRRWRAEVGSHEERVRGPSPARDYDQLARKRYGDLHPAPICVQVFVTSVTISRSTAIS